VPEAASSDSLAWLEGLNARWVVLDGYAFGESYARRLQSKGVKVCALDDLGVPLPVDLSVNPNLFAQEAPQPSGVRCLAGAGYALVRDEFLGARRERLEHELREGARRGRRLLLTFGGSDTASLTERAIDLLSSSAAEIGEVELTVVIGAGHPHPEKVRAAAARSALPVRIIEATRHMGSAMAEADAALTAGGTTVVELMCVGVPCMVLAVAPNQERVGPALAAHGAGIDLGDAHRLDGARLGAALKQLFEPGQRRAMAAAGRACVDGLGARRVIGEMERA